MAKFLTLWRTNPNAPWPTDPGAGVQLNEMMFAAIDNMLKTGEILEFGYFPNGRSGYLIASGETKDQFRDGVSFSPFIEMDVFEVVPYETGKEVMRGVFKAQAEQMAAMKR